MELSSPKNFLIFFSKKAFLIFWEMELSSPKLKKLFYFFKNKFSYILGGSLQKPKNKKNLI